MKRFHVTHCATILAAGILYAVFFLSLTGCSKGTGACDDEQTIKAISDAALESTKKQLDFVAGFSGGELSEDEWNSIRLGIRVTVDNIKQTAKVGGRYTCSADVVIHQTGGRDSIPVTYVSELTGAGEVKVMVSGM